VLEWIGLGDAYGACFEYADPTPDRPNDLSGYFRHPRHAIVPGCYTDDTQMSIAVAETMIAGDLSRQAFAEAFVRCFRRDPRTGYSRRMQTFLASCRNGSDLLRRVRPDSVKSGAAMRACPIGIMSDEDEVRRIAAVQAEITHNTPTGVTSAQAVALAAHALLHERCVRTELPSWIAARLPGEWAQRWVGRVGSSGADSARAAIWAVAEHDDMAALLRDCVDLMGDVDTVSAMALGIASCSPSVIRNIPAALMDGLAEKQYGWHFLVHLSTRLRAAASTTVPSGGAAT
jgi:ADP-ribosylglycohydrolase